MKQKTVAQYLRSAPKNVEVPWEVYRIFNCKSVYLSGDMAGLSDNGDAATLSELRLAVEWYVKQLDGKVNWDEQV